MKKIRRVPRKVGQDDDDGDTEGSNTSQAQESSSAVRRPGLSGLKSTKPHRSSSLRTTILAVADDNDEDTNSTLAAQTSSRRSNLIQQTFQRSAQSRLAQLPLRSGEAEDDRPSYSADYLAELRNSTPSTPRDLTIAPNNATSRSIDIASKFGGDAVLELSYNLGSTAIPTDVEIQEKKERRRRLAKEQDFISLGDQDREDESNSDGSDGGDYGKKSLIVTADDIDLKSKYGETRLEHEDEDIAEGFDSFVEDAGKVTLGRKAAKEQEAQRKKDIAEQIRSAQHGYGYGAGVSEDEEDDENDEVDEEEVARNAAYEAAQTRAGMYGSTTNHQREKNREQSLKNRLEIQPKIKPIPDLKTVVNKFRDVVALKEAELNAARKRLESLEREQSEIAIEEVRIKQLLKDAGDRFEKLQSETLGPVPATTNGGSQQESRGLDNVSDLSAVATPAGDTQDSDNQEDDASMEESEEEEETAQHTTMADMFPGAGMGLGMGGGFSGMGGVHEDEDDY